MFALKQRVFEELDFAFVNQKSMFAWDYLSYSKKCDCHSKIWKSSRFMIDVEFWELCQHITQNLTHRCHCFCFWRISSLFNIVFVVFVIDRLRFKFATMIARILRLVVDSLIFLLRVAIFSNLSRWSLNATFENVFNCSSFESLKTSSD